MKKITRYTASHLLLRFGFCLFAALAFFFLADLFENARMLPKTESLSVACKLYLYKVPLFLMDAIPLSLLLAVLLSLGDLTKTNEVTAALVGGHSPLSLSRSTFFVAAAAALSLLALGEYLIPPASRALDQLFNELLQRPPSSPYAGLYRRQSWFRGTDGTIFHIGSGNIEEGVFGDVQIYFFDEAFHLDETIRAKALRYVDSQWTAADGSRRGFGTTPHYEEFRSLELQRPERPESFVGAVGTPDGLSLRNLWRHMALRRQQGYDASLYESAFYRRLGRPVMTLFVCFLALPLGFRTHKGHEVALQMAKGGVIASILIGLELLGTALTTRSLITAWTSALLPNLLLLVSGAYLWMKILRQP